MPSTLDASAMKVLIYVPGRLVNSSNQPLPGQPLSVSYSFAEGRRHFNIIDGPTTSIPIANGTTDASGSFTVDVPSFRDDPFFQRYTVAGHEGFHLSSTGSGFNAFGDDTLR